MIEANMVNILLTWKQVGVDQWEFTNPALLHAPARVMYAVRADREVKNFRWKALVNKTPYWFRTENGAKQWVENYIAQKGKL